MKQRGLVCAEPAFLKAFRFLALGHWQRRAEYSGINAHSVPQIDVSDSHEKTLDAGETRKDTGM